MTKKKFTSLLVVALLLVLFAMVLFFFHIHTYSGTVIGVSEGSNGEKNSIWVVELNKNEHVEGKTKKELSETHKFGGTIYYLPSYYPDFLFDNLEIGDKVKIYSDDIFKLSSPGQNDAYWVRKLHD
ncbi:DUF3221 domain-containing protein [Paenisporosarcina cavernae]|uniref:DUF3221 domain-containing protein n=1 Tax=Paenisporosarcina cavernae TaxID=2320858 RepID=A0A385YYA6_9BACL|nr:DUF3221 domain-containing protein [Paenisporosarcina cavernae]AYC30513.1 hypothetical protein D3873_11970 [Paenisporosarcina cavernae]